MRGSNRYVNRAAGLDDGFETIQCHLCGSRNDHPVLGAAGVFLIAEARLRPNLDTLDFVSVPFIEDGKTAPWPFFTHGTKIHHRTLNTLLTSVALRPSSFADAERDAKRRRTFD